MCPPNNQPAVHREDQAVARGPAGVNIMLIRDLNAQLVQTRDTRKEDLVTSITSYGLVDQTLHIIPRRRYRGKRGW